MDSSKQQRRVVPDLFVTKDNWTHYLYRIDFEDECEYTGLSSKKGEDPYSDGYYGSPVTNKEKWETTPFTKTVLCLMHCTDLEAYALESEYQLMNCDLNSEKCLNGHFGGGFSRDVCAKAGKIGSRVQVEQKIGIHSLSSEERSRKSKEIWDKLSDEERERRAKALRYAYDSLSDERKEELKQTLSVKTREYYDSLSDDEKVDRVKPMVEAAKNANTCDWILLSPDGETIVVTNLTEFCKRNGLAPSLMSHVYSGKRNHHKGWKVLEKKFRR